MQKKPAAAGEGEKAMKLSGRLRLRGPSARAGHVYRDRRRRLWGLSRGRLMRFAGVSLGALMLLALLIPLGRAAFRSRTGMQPDQPPRPSPTAEPAPTAQPTPTPVPSMVRPFVTEEAQPSLNIDSREALIDLYWWMIHSGGETVELEALTLPAETISEVTDKFSNYFSGYTYGSEPPFVRVAFKTGLSVLRAIEDDDVARLNSEGQEIARLAREIVDTTVREGMSDFEIEAALHDYVVGHCQYLSYDPDIDTGDARGFFQYGRCQCAGYVDAFRLLARLAGLEVEMLGGPTTRDTPDMKGHAWNLIRLDGLWYVVDVTWDDMIADTAAPEHAFFNLPPAAFGSTRSWDESCCPKGDAAAVVDEKYYYNRPAFAAGDVETAVRLAIPQIEADGAAYIYFTGEDLVRETSVGLVQYFQAQGSVVELSADLEISLYKFELGSTETAAAGEIVSE